MAKPIVAKDAVQGAAPSAKNGSATARSPAPKAAPVAKPAQVATKPAPAAKATPVAARTPAPKASRPPATAKARSSSKAAGRRHSIAVLAGDGIGEEVIREGLKVLDAVAEIEGFVARAEDATPTAPTTT